MDDPFGAVQQLTAKKVQELCELEDGLTSWEVNFVDDLSHQDPGSFTMKQMEHVARIYKRLIGD